MRKMITTDFFSTLDISLVSLSVKTLFRKGDVVASESKSCELLEDVTGVSRSNMHFFLNARSGLYHALLSYGLGEGDEVIITGWNCVSVVNLVLQTGATPILGDIKTDSFTLSYKSVLQKISPRTKAIILQGTFGMPGEDFEAIISMCKEKGIVVIDDAAHSFGNTDEYNFDARVYSFGRDKVLSSVTGGLVVFPGVVPEYFQTLVQNEIKGKELRKHFYYNIFGYLACKSYSFFGLGKVIMLLARKLKLFPEILSLAEKECKYSDFDYSYPKELFPLLEKEIEEYKTLQSRRKEIYLRYQIALKGSKLYAFPTGLEHGNYFRIPLILQTQSKELDLREELLVFMKQSGVYLGSQWSGVSLCPVGSKYEGQKSLESRIPVTQDMVKKVVFLPNHRNINAQDTQRIIKLLHEFEEKYV